ncbi:MAG: SLC13 family permease [Bacilli bacterium]|jgi:Na+/H+ antiporter NhaD/arsenite permease-like protein
MYKYFEAFISKMHLALIIFVITYVLLLVFSKYRAYIALGSAVVFVVLGFLPLSEILKTLDWNVLMMIAGTMGIVALFIESKMPSLLADMIIEKVPNMKWAIISLSIFAGVISAFVDNVATVLMVAPVALNISKKLKISPVPALICIAISSNLQGAATLVGDTTSIMLAGELDMNFIDFIWYRGRPGIFFGVELGAVASVLVLLFIFRNERNPLIPHERTEVKDKFPTILLISMVCLLIAASFVPKTGIKFLDANINGLIVMFLLLIGLIRKLFQTKSIRSLGETVKEIDYFTILLLASLFIIIAGISEAGVIAAIADLIDSIGGGNTFAVYTMIVSLSVLVSAFIDNIPYVATMLPVVGTLAFNLGLQEPAVLYFGLLTGATLGGNLTPIGASANIAAIGILRKDGYEVKPLQFMKFGVPFTLAAVITGYLFIWLVWGM